MYCKKALLKKADLEICKNFKILGKILTEKRTDNYLRTYKTPPNTTVNSNTNTTSMQKMAPISSIELGEYEYFETHGFTVRSSQLRNENIVIKPIVNSN